MKRREAFRRMISQRSIHKKLGVESSTVRNLRVNLKKGAVSEEKMKELLLKAGWQVSTEETWINQY